MALAPQRALPKCSAAQLAEVLLSLVDGKSVAMLSASEKNAKETGGKDVDFAFKKLDNVFFL